MGGDVLLTSSSCLKATYLFKDHGLVSMLTSLMNSSRSLWVSVLFIIIRFRNQHLQGADKELLKLLIAQQRPPTKSYLFHIYDSPITQFSLLKVMVTILTQEVLSSSDKIITTLSVHVIYLLWSPFNFFYCDNDHTESTLIGPRD